MAPRHSHTDLLAIVRDCAGAVLGSRLLLHAEGGPPDTARLAGRMGFGRREVMQLAELLEEELGITLQPRDMARLLGLAVELRHVAHLLAEVLERQDATWPAPRPAPIAILGVRRHAG